MISLVENLRYRVGEYIDSFKDYDTNVLKHIFLKKKHIFEVEKLITDIGNSIALNVEDISKARAIALLHDIGRFVQYTKYHTFSDRDSENHSIIALRVIGQEGFLDEFADKLLIEKAIMNHNVAKIHSNIIGKELLFSKLIRDADKADIYRVVLEYYNDPMAMNDETVRLGLPNTDEVSEMVYNSIMNSETVMISEMKSIIDFKLLQLSWIYEIHFSRTFEIIFENDYINKLFLCIPLSKETNILKEKIIADLYLRAKKD